MQWCRLRKRNKLILDSKRMKICKSEDYNFVFNKEDGQFARWGRTKEEDPLFSPFGPEIADIEISTICNGVGGPCKFCYKKNGPRGENMSLDTFKKVLNKLTGGGVSPLGQVAFGIGDIDANPDMWLIFEECRKNGIVPNVTINGNYLEDYHVKRLSELCGAVAVSRYEPKDVCYDAVKRLTDAGMNQVNIHQLMCAESFDDCMALIDDYNSDERLKDMRAVVFLALKPQGRGTSLTPLSNVGKYKQLIEKAFSENVPCGFDSCSASIFLKAMEDSPKYKEYEMLAEPCESYLFSIYVDVFGRTVPCSFLEGKREAIDILSCDNFLKDIWNGPIVGAWREELLATANSDDSLVKGCRQCPVYDIY